MVEAAAAYVAAQRALKIAAGLAAKSVPVALAAPTISGTRAPGNVLTGVHGDYAVANTGYTYRWLKGGTALATTLTYTVQSSDAGAAITFEETPTNGIGAGPANISAAVTIQAAAPAAVTLGTPVVSNGALTIPWTDGATGGAAIDGRFYAIGTAANGEGALLPAIITGGNLIITGLTNGTKYYVEGFAHNSLGYSLPSNEVSGTPTLAVAVGVPSGFTYAVPFTIYRSGTGTGSTFTTDYNPQNKRPAPNATVYVGPGGNNNNDGTTYATRVRSMSLAIKMANALGVATVGIQFEGGQYLRTNTQARSGQATLNATYPDCWDVIQVNSPTCNLVVEPYDGVSYMDSVMNAPALTYTPFVGTSAPSVGSIYKTASTSGSYQVADYKNLDAYGEPSGCEMLSVVANSADPSPELVSAAAVYGSACYVDTTLNIRYVYLKDGRAPDAQVIEIGNTGSYAGMSSAATAPLTIWMKNCKFRGGTQYVFSTYAASGIPVNRYEQNCVFSHGGHPNLVGAAVHRNGPGEIIRLNCKSLYHTNDAFAPYGFDTTAANCPTTAEIGCASFLTGIRNTNTTGLGQVNGSTSHGACRSVRVNGQHFDNIDRTIHDIGNTLTWDVGLTVSNRRTEQVITCCGYAVGQAGQSAPYATKWMDACKVVASKGGLLPLYNTEAAAGCTLNYTNLRFTPTAGDGTGTVAAYTG